MATTAAPAPSQGHPPTSTGLDNRKIAIWAFIGSECMLFTSLISTYLVYKGRSVVGPFPHEACNPPQCATQLPAMPLSEEVIADYQTQRLSLKAHPMSFLRASLAERGFVRACDLRSRKHPCRRLDHRQ